MQEYLKNIVKRIQGYSKELDAIEVFVDKKWIYIDDLSRQHQYTFLRDKRLVMSVGGITKTGRWDLLPTKQLLINRIADEILLDKFFIEKALLVMKLTGSDDEPFVLINKDEIPDLDVPKYLEKFEEEKNTSIGDINRGVYLKENGEIVGNHFYEGMTIRLENGTLLNGVYKNSRNDISQFIVVSNNVIKQLYYLVKYKYENFDISIQQKDLFIPQKGDRVVSDDNVFIPINTNFKIESYNDSIFKISCKHGGEIKTVSVDWHMVELLFIAVVLTILIFFMAIFLN